MKIVYLLLAALIFQGCETTIQKEYTEDRLNGFRVMVYTIDSCEYIAINGDTRTLSHKGNCKYCLQRTKP